MGTSQGAFEVSRFDQVDATDDPRSFVEYLDWVSTQATVQAIKRRVTVLLDAKHGRRILDVGCGTGDAVRELAQLVGNAGRVVGVDNSGAMIAEAQKRSEGLGLPLEFRLGNAYRLEFPDHSFDGSHALRVFQHLENPQRALAEMVRVLRPGGTVVVQDPDWGTVFVDAPDLAVTHRILNFRAQGSVRNPWMGRQLYGRFRETGLTDITVQSFTVTVTDAAASRDLGIENMQGWAQRAHEAGVVAAAEAANWVASLEAAVENGRYCAGFMGFIVAGRKP